MFFLLKVSLFGNPSSENVKMEIEMSSRGVEKQIKKLREDMFGQRYVYIDGKTWTYSINNAKKMISLCFQQ